MCKCQGQSETLGNLAAPTPYRTSDSFLLGTPDHQRWLESGWSILSPELNYQSSGGGVLNAGDVGDIAPSVGLTGAQPATMDAALAPTPAIAAVANPASEISTETLLVGAAVGVAILFVAMR